jgi:hypothetical protein
MISYCLHRYGKYDVQYGHYWGGGEYTYVYEGGKLVMRFSKFVLLKSKKRIEKLLVLK